MACMDIWFGESYISIVPFLLGFCSRPFGRRPVRSWPFCFKLFFASADLAPGLLVLARGLVFGAAISTLKYNGNYWELSLRVRDIFGLNAHAHVLDY